MRIERVVKINCTPEHLWPFLDEPDKQKLWMKGLLENRRIDPGPPRAGSKFKMKIKEGGKVGDYDGEVTAYDRPRHLGVRFWGGGFPAGMVMLCDYRLSAENGGTQMEYVAQSEGWRPGLFLRLLMPLFMLFTKMQLRGFLKTLKRLAEAPAAG
jgi:hypothetical protein